MQIKVDTFNGKHLYSLRTTTSSEIGNMQMNLLVAC